MTKYAQKFALLFLILSLPTVALAGRANAAVYIKTASLPNGVVGTAYSADVLAQSGTLPYTWSSTGTLPPGLVLSTVGTTKWKANLHGTPGIAGSYSFSVKVTDAAGTNYSRTYTVIITSTITISIAPTTATVPSGGQQQFTASGGAVTWTSTCGSVSSTGLFSAPAVTILTSCQVTATAQADSSKYMSAVVTIQPPVNHTVDLAWQDPGNPVGTITVYNVYRSQTSGSGYNKISSVGAKLYTDSAVLSGQTYYYVVTAVDTTGAESAYSNEAQAVIP
jgi:hypothetical protein